MSRQFPDDSGPDPLAGRVAVVTGSSSGIGRAIALELAAAGAACLVHARESRDAAEAVAREIRAAGGDAMFALADISVPDERGEFVDQVWNWRGAVDIWVNNAGADVLTGEASGWTFERKLERLWEVDVLGTVALSRKVGRRMRAEGGGTIINIGWDQAEFGMAGDSGEMFATIKGAVIAFSRSLARSLAPQVRVNCVAPGWIKTAWGDNASGYWQERAEHEALLERWGTPEDVAAAVRFLVSPAANFITGHILPVNGGFRGAFRSTPPAKS
jgi:3-oxoacyl-[acyl-carrier protein] reductase